MTRFHLYEIAGRLCVICALCSPINTYVQSCYAEAGYYGAKPLSYHIPFWDEKDSVQSDTVRESAVAPIERHRPSRSENIVSSIQAGSFVRSALPDFRKQDDGSIVTFACPVCGIARRVMPPKRVERKSSSVHQRCSACGTLVFVWARTRSGELRPASWFLQGFSSAQSADVRQMWRNVLQRVRYRKDHRAWNGGKRDIWQVADETWNSRQGDCEDSAILLADLLLAASYDARVVLGQVRGDSHAWVELLHNGQRYWLEATGRSRRRLDLMHPEQMPDYVAHFMFNREYFWSKVPHKGSWGKYPKVGTHPRS